MIEQLKIWVINIAALVTFIVLLEILVPSGKTKKFVNLVSGFILIIAIINPIVGIVKKGLNLPELQVAGSNFIEKRDIEQSSKVLKEKQMKQIVDAYRGKLIKQLEDTARQVPGVTDIKADVIFNEDYRSESFGEIKRVFLNVSTEDKNMAAKPAVKVERIEINTRDRPKEEKKAIDSKIKSELEAKVSKILDVQKENIVIAASDTRLEQ